MVPSPSGKARVCKTLIPSSSLGVASKKPKWRNGRRKGFKIPRRQLCAGSSPAFGTRKRHAKACLFQLNPLSRCIVFLFFHKEIDDFIYLYHFSILYNIQIPVIYCIYNCIYENRKKYNDYNDINNV